MAWTACRRRGGEAAGREAGRTAQSWHIHVLVPTGPGKGSELPGIELNVEGDSLTSHMDLPLGKVILKLARFG